MLPLHHGRIWWTRLESNQFLRFFRPSRAPATPPVHIGDWDEIRTHDYGGCSSAPLTSWIPNQLKNRQHNSVLAALYKEAKGVKSLVACRLFFSTGKYTLYKAWTESKFETYRFCHSVFLLCYCKVFLYPYYLIIDYFIDFVYYIFG